jgi:hypothetical protein
MRKSLYSDFLNENWFCKDNNHDGIMDVSNLHMFIEYLQICLEISQVKINTCLMQDMTKNKGSAT